MIKFFAPKLCETSWRYRVKENWIGAIRKSSLFGHLLTDQKNILRREENDLCDGFRPKTTFKIRTEQSSDLLKQSESVTVINQWTSQRETPLIWETPLLNRSPTWDVRNGFFAKSKTYLHFNNGLAYGKSIASMSLLLVANIGVNLPVLMEILTNVWTGEKKPVWVWMNIC